MKKYLWFIIPFSIFFNLKKIVSFVFINNETRKTKIKRALLLDAIIILHLGLIIMIITYVYNILVR